MRKQFFVTVFAVSSNVIFGLPDVQSGSIIASFQGFYASENAEHLCRLLNSALSETVESYEGVSV
jgi:hypothetical protein